MLDCDRCHRQRFYRLVRGRDPLMGPCTSQLELSDDHRRLVLRLASTLRFSVSLDARAVSGVLASLDEARPCTVEVGHAEYGPRRLSVEPYEGRMSLYLALPREDIRVAFDRTSLVELIAYLEEGVAQLVHRADRKASQLGR
jgi:hypothetical protein